MNRFAREGDKLSPFFLFFLFYVGIAGIGALSFQTSLAAHAGYDAWISVIATGATVHVLVWMTYRTLSSEPGERDVADLHRAWFGRLAGAFLNAAVVLYFLYAAYAEWKTYLEVIEVWLFPGMNRFPVVVMVTILIYYAVSGGIRTVAGLSFWGMILAYFLVIPQIFLALQYAHPRNLLPLFDHSAADVLAAAKSMAVHYSGFEVLLFVYPFLKNPADSQRWAHGAVLFGTVLYLILLLTTFMYFSVGQLEHTVWPTLNMTTIIEFPFFQRLEYLAISLWLIKNIAGVSLSLWAAGRAASSVWPIGERRWLLGFLLVMLAFDSWVAGRDRIDRMLALYVEIAFYFLYAYIPLLFVCTLVRSRWLRRSRRANAE